MHGGQHPPRSQETSRRRSGRQPRRPYRTIGKSCSWPLLVLSRLVSHPFPCGFILRRHVAIQKTCGRPSSRHEPTFLLVIGPRALKDTLAKIIDVRLASARCLHLLPSGTPRVALALGSRPFPPCSGLFDCSIMSVLSRAGGPLPPVVTPPGIDDGQFDTCVLDLDCDRRLVRGSRNHSALLRQKDLASGHKTQSLSLTQTPAPLNDQVGL